MGIGTDLLQGNAHFPFDRGMQAADQFYDIGRNAPPVDPMRHRRMLQSRALLEQLVQRVQLGVAGLERGQAPADIAH